MVELGSMTDKFSGAGQNVARRAIEVSRNCNHNYLGLLHILAALSEIESALFAEAMRAIGVDPHSVKSMVNQELSQSPVHVGPKMAIPELTRDLFNRALRRARSQGRQRIESYDLFASLFADLNGTPAEILRRLGVDPALAADAISQLVRPGEQLSSMMDKFSETGQKVMRRAIEVSRSHAHGFLSLSHVFTALIEIESAFFAEATQAVGVDPRSVTNLLDQVLSESPRQVRRKMAIPEETRDLLNRALRRALSQGRRQIESYDLFATLFTDPNGAPAELLLRLGVDPAQAVAAGDKISQPVRRREEQTRDRTFKILKTQSFNFSRLTAGFLNSMVTLREKGVTPALWETTDVSLTEHERQRVEAIISSLEHKSILLMNEATIWSRAIYPLLVLAEQDELEAWAQLPLKAEYPRFVLEGIADGAVGYNLSGPSKSFCLIVVEVKRESEAQDPLSQLYGAMLAAAQLNWAQDNQVPQEIYGCYTVADSWIFAHGLVADIEDLRPTMTVALSRAYSEKVEAETILRILKSITGKFAIN